MVYSRSVHVIIRCLGKEQYSVHGAVHVRGTRDNTAPGLREREERREREREREGDYRITCTLIEVLFYFRHHTILFMSSCTCVRGKRTESDGKQRREE